ncbi:MAG: glycosyltransferase [Kiritimatiellia bacterium]|jgi:glycosyltransferase involved in cell wall biosynthesis
MEHIITQINAQTDKVEDWSCLPEDPLVSVFMTTYNHGRFIAQALDGILMQEVDFSYEIVIGEDKSTDRTREIVCEYQRKHPAKIRLRLSRENLYSQGLKPGAAVLYACRGKYIAFCEGDDYWTDPKKLQKQVAALEAKPEISACYTNAAVENENGDAQPSVWLGHKGPSSCAPKPEKTYLSQIDIIRNHSIPTCTLLARAAPLRRLPPWFFRIPTGDWGFAMILTENGPVKFMDEITAVYRRHSGGVWSVRTSLDTMVDFARRMQIYLPHAPPDVRTELKKTLSKHLARLRAHASEVMAQKLEAEGGWVDFEMDWAEMLSRMARRRMRLDAWVLYFQKAYFKGDMPCARQRLFRLLARHPEWLFCRGSVGKIWHVIRGGAMVFPET